MRRIAPSSVAVASPTARSLRSLTRLPYTSTARPVSVEAAGTIIARRPLVSGTGRSPVATHAAQPSRKVEAGHSASSSAPST